MRALVSRFLALFRPAQLDEDLDADVRAHLDLLEAEYMRRGESADVARMSARRAFGGVEQIKEIHRDHRTFRELFDCLRDARFAVRLLARERWFAAAAALALALGIAATNTVFLLINGLFLRDLPFDNPDRVVVIGTSVGGSSRPNAGVSYLDLHDLAAAQRTFDGVGAASETTMNVAEEGRAPERFTGAYVSANVVALTGQVPVIGRGFAPSDDVPGATGVVILSDSLWRTRYSGDPSVLGRSIRVNGVDSTVIGVMGDGFGFPTRSRLWLPLGQLPDDLRQRRDARALRGFGRLKSGITSAQAADDLARAAGVLAGRHPQTNRGVQPRVAPYRDADLGGRLRTMFPILMALVVFVLLIACANVANLLLARAAYRTREIAVRFAVGASRAQVVRQLLVESVVLAAIAGLIGLLFSWIGIEVFQDAFRDGGGLPYWIAFPMDWRVFTFLAFVCLGTAIVFGLVPALEASGTRILGRLIEAGTGNTGTMRQRRWTTRLVIAQLALTPVLLTGAGLMMRSMIAQQEIDPGVDTSGLVRMKIELTGPAYQSSDQRERFYRDLEDRFAGDANIRATLASHAPFEGSSVRRLSIDGRPVTDARGQVMVRLMTVGRTYFDVLAASPVIGARFDGRTAASAIVNTRFADVYFEGRSPVGHRLGLTAVNRDSGGPVDVDIIGLAPDIRQSSTEAPASAFEPIVYLPYVANPLSRASVLVRSNAGAGAVGSLVRQHVSAIDRDLPIYEVMALDASLEMSDERLGLRVFGTIVVLIGAVALLLASLGLYAVTAYATAQRTREIGIRVALGSRPSQIGWLIARRATRHLAIGLLIGTVGSLALTQLMRGVLIGIVPGDYWTLVGVAGLLIVVTVAASAIPAGRATRLNPVTALRND